MYSPRGDGNVLQGFLLVSPYNAFEKCIPREGTETSQPDRQWYFSFLIWEMYSPRGDGNKYHALACATRRSYLRNVFPARGRKRSSAIGRMKLFQFEKCIPREGTETSNNQSYKLQRWYIWEMYSPWGDGNSFWFSLNVAFIFYLRNVFPREGTETRRLWALPARSKQFEKCIPREGTETDGGLLGLCLGNLFEKCIPREGTEICMPRPFPAW